MITTSVENQSSSLTQKEKEVVSEFVSKVQKEAQCSVRYNEYTTEDGEDPWQFKGQLLGAVPLNSLHGVPAPTYYPYLKWEPFRHRDFLCLIL